MLLKFRGQLELCRTLGAAVVEGCGPESQAPSGPISDGFLGMVLFEVVGQLLPLPEDEVTYGAGEQLCDRLRYLEIKQIIFFKPNLMLV